MRRRRPNCYEIFFDKVFADYVTPFSTRVDVLIPLLNGMVIEESEKDDEEKQTDKTEN